MADHYKLLTAKYTFHCTTLPQCDPCGISYFRAAVLPCVPSLHASSFFRSVILANVYFSCKFKSVGSAGGACVAGGRRLCARAGEARRVGRARLGEFYALPEPREQLDSRNINTSYSSAAGPLTEAILLISICVLLCGAWRTALCSNRDVPGEGSGGKSPLAVTEALDWP